MADLIVLTPSFSHPLLPGASLGGAVDLGSEEAMCSGDCVRLGWNRCRLLGPGKRCVTLWRVQKPQRGDVAAVVVVGIEWHGWL